MKTEMKKSTLDQVKAFIPEVKIEIKKVTWPTRKETMVTTAFVFAFALIAAIFFLVVDQIIYKAINWIIGLGH